MRSDRTSLEERAAVEAVAPDLARVFEKLVRRDPERRYQSAEQVIAALEPLRERRGAEGDVATFLRLVRRRIDAPQEAEPTLDERLRASDDPRWAALAARRPRPTSPPARSVPAQPARGGHRLLYWVAGILSLGVGLAAALLAGLAVSAG